MTGGTRFTAPDAGGMHQPPALGLASTVRLLQAGEDDANQHFYFGVLLQSLFFLLVAPLALWAWLKNRQERTYLWLFFPLACSLLRNFLVVFGNLRSVLPIELDTLVLDVVLGPLLLPLWAIFWWHWFGLREKRWIPRAVWGITAAEMLALFCVRLPTADVNLVPRPWLPALNTASVVCLFALGVLLLIILIEGFRRDRTEALLAAVPLLLIEFSSFNVFILNTFGISSIFSFSALASASRTSPGSSWCWSSVRWCCAAFSTRRQVRSAPAKSSRSTSNRRSNCSSASSCPRSSTHPPSPSKPNTVPPKTVGGDFFQTLSKPDGSLLVVVGDVSGKGMSAAMLVAVLVGAIRTRADESFDPAAMLTMLNQRLIGRSGGHLATCLAAELRPNGEMRIANAGHLPPYLNGQELPLEGSLPLGAADVIDPSSRTITLQPGDHLTLLTDGVVEAMNSASELFGFDRARTISSQPAAAIVQQAQAFGQKDDITVLSIEFIGAPSEAADAALAAV